MGLFNETLSRRNPDYSLTKKRYFNFFFNLTGLARRNKAVNDYYCHNAVFKTGKENNGNIVK